MYKRKVDKLGRIVIPKKLTKMLNFQDWQDVEITIEYGNICVKAFNNEEIEQRPYVGIVRMLDKINRLTIPAEYLNVLQIKKGDLCEITVVRKDDYDIIVIQK